MQNKYILPGCECNSSVFARVIETSEQNDYHCRITIEGIEKEFREVKLNGRERRGNFSREVF